MSDETPPLSAALDKLLELAHREGVNRFPPSWAKESWYERTMKESDEYRAAIAAFRAAIEDTTARAVRCEGVDADYAALVEVAQGVNTSLRLLPLTGINDAQHIYDSMYKILDRLARWLIDTPDYPGKPAPREIPSRP